MKLNVIIPLYNEEECIIDFYNETSNVLKDIDYKLLFINDGSTDNSLKILKDIYENDKKRVGIITFSRNFGKESAIYAGLEYSNAEYTVIIDADMQQDPKYIITMLNKLENDDDIDNVCMVQKQKKKRLLQNIFYKIINKISKVNFVNGASDFRMLRKNVVKSILSLSEKNRFSKGFFSWVGYNTIYLEYKVKPRIKGKSKWGFLKLFNYAIDGFINFSTAPLKISIYSGFITGIGALVYFIYIIVKTLILGKDVPGYASTISLVLFFGGLQLICIGVLGEYLAKTYMETKNRPIYIEKEKIGFNETLL